MAGLEYAKLLEDLRKQREKLNAAIAGLEVLLEMPAANHDASSSAERPVFRVPAGQKSVRETLKDTLREAPNRRLSAGEALKRLVAAGWQTTAKNPYSVVYSTFLRMSEAGEVKKSGAAWKLIEEPDAGSVRK